MSGRDYSTHCLAPDQPTSTPITNSIMFAADDHRSYNAFQNSLGTPNLTRRSQICRSGKHPMIAEQDRARRGSLSPRRCAAPPGAPPSGSRASRIGQPSRLPAVRWTERQEATSAAVWATHEHCAVSCAQRRDAPSGAWSKRARLHRYRRLIRRCRPHLHQLPHGRCGWHRTHTRACLPAHT